MSQYNAQPDSTAGNTAWDDSAPELAPFSPAVEQQSASSSPAAHGGTVHSVGSAAAMIAAGETMALHAKAECIGSHASNGLLVGGKAAIVNWGTTSHIFNDDSLEGGNSAGHFRTESDIAHTCSACSSSFPNNYQLEQHATKNKHKAYLCTCRKAFTKLSALRRHFEESTKDREHQCPLCDNGFKRPGHVEQHLCLVHKKPKDVIKDLLSAQKSQPRQEPGQASTASTAVPTTGSTDGQANHPIANPGGPWTGPIDFSAPAPAPADYPSSRPVCSSAFSDFSAPGPGHMTEAPGLVPQGFMTQAPILSTYPTYPAGAGAAQNGFPANPAPDFVGYPAAPSDGHLDLSNVVLGSLFVNLDDDPEMPALGNDFTWEPFGSDFNTFNF